LPNINILISRDPRGHAELTTVGGNSTLGHTSGVTEPVVIGRSHDGLSVLDVRHDRGGDADQVLVRLTKEGLSAECWIYAHEGRGFDGLTAFFQSLADDWRVWSGQREWTSLEGDLDLAAVHDGHVRLAVSLRRSIDWSVTANVSIDPGEALAAASRDLTELLG